MKNLTDKEIQNGLDEAYKKAGHNAYFGNGFKAGVEFALKQEQSLSIDNDSSCPFEAYAVFCIECDRQGIKPIKHKDYLKIG